MLQVLKLGTYSPKKAHTCQRKETSASFIWCLHYNYHQRTQSYHQPVLQFMPRIQTNIPFRFLLSTNTPAFYSKPKPPLWLASAANVRAAWAAQWNWEGVAFGALPGGVQSSQSAKFLRILSSLQFDILEYSGLACRITHVGPWLHSLLVIFLQSHALRFCL